MSDNVTSEIVDDSENFPDDPPVTIETWAEYAKERAYPIAGAFYDYLRAVHEMIPSIEKASNAENFEEMKAELTKLLKERKDFLAYADNNIPHIP